MENIKIIQSEDGSNTLFHIGLNETYHSTHGAIQESEHVFIKNGLDYLLEKGTKEIVIFEVGFGTGLNAWLTYKKIKALDVSVIYYSLEPFPLSAEVYEKLNYVTFSEDEELKQFYLEMHRAAWEEEVKFNDKFVLKKIKQGLEDFPITEGFFNLIYFDAFAPSKQEVMWVPENIAKTYFLLKPEGVFVTYCAKGQFKRDLKAVGYTVETLLGPPGKKEMTRGLK